LRRPLVLERLLLTSVLTAVAPLLQAALPAASATPLHLEAIAVQPSEPGPDTLCELRLKIQNRGTLPASRFAWSVRVNGVELPVYRRLRYFQAVPPQATTELRLYNFWSTESSRPMPPDAKLKVEVQLTHAEWVRIERDGKGTETWTPAGDIQTLPAALSVTLPMTRPAR
jgi:hypothetical protein